MGEAGKGGGQVETGTCDPGGAGGRGEESRAGRGACPGEAPRKIAKSLLSPQRSKGLLPPSVYIGIGCNTPSSPRTPGKVLMQAGMGGCLGSGAKEAWLSGSPPPTLRCLWFQLSALPPAVSRKGKRSEDRGTWGTRGEPGSYGRGGRGGGVLEGGSWGFPAPAVVPLSPAGGSTILYNCSTCQEFKVRCWPRKRCLPGSTPRPGLPSLGSPSSQRPPPLPHDDW